jgi:O-antigen ligase
MTGGGAARQTTTPLLLLLVVAVAAVMAGYVAVIEPVAAVVAMAAAGIVVVMWLRAELVLLGLVALLPWEALVTGPNAELGPARLAGALVALAFIVDRLRRPAPIRVPALLWLAFALLIVALASTAFVSPDNTSVSETMRYVSSVGLLFFAYQLIRDEGQVVQIAKVYVASAAGAAAYGLVAFLNGSVDRASGPIADANDFAFFLATAACLAAYLAARERPRAIWTACLVLLMLGTFATLSRGGLLALAGAGLWAVVARRVRVAPLVAGFALVVAVAGFLVSNNLTTIEQQLTRKEHASAENVESRQAFWGAAVRMAADAPALGVGPGEFDTHKREYLRGDLYVSESAGLLIAANNVHNTYLHIAAELGLLAFALFLAYLLGVWRTLRAAASRRGRMNIAAALQASWLAALIAGFFISVQFEAPFWLIGALAMVLVSTPQREIG